MWGIVPYDQYLFVLIDYSKNAMVLARDRQASDQQG